MTLAIAERVTSLQPRFRSKKLEGLADVIVHVAPLQMDSVRARAKFTLIIHTRCVCFTVTFFTLADVCASVCAYVRTVIDAYNLALRANGRIHAWGKPLLGAEALELKISPSQSHWRKKF